MTKTKSKPEKLPWDFKVKQINLGEIPELKGIKDLERDILLIDADQNSKLGIVTTEYSVFPHNEAVNKTLEAIEEVSKTDKRFGNFKLNNDKVILRRNKSFMKLDIDFPDLNFNIGKIKKVNDYVNFKMSIINSLDGKNRLKWPIGGTRLICSNGLSVFSEIDSVSFVHRGIHIPSLKEAILNELQSFQKNVIGWKQLSKKSLKKEDVAKLFSVMEKRNKKDKLIGRQHLKNIIQISEEIFEKEGRNLWTFYNLASNYTTHSEKVNNSIYTLDRVQEIHSFFYNTVLKVA